MQEKNENFDVIKKRILEFVEKQKIGKYNFYGKAGLSQSNFAGKSMLSALSSAKITEILMLFPELSPDWLLLGKGEMLRKEGEKTTENTEEFVVSEKIFRELLEKNEELNRHIGRLEAELEHCKKAGAPQAEHATFAVAAGEK